MHTPEAQTAVLQLPVAANDASFRFDISGARPFYPTFRVTDEGEALIPTVRTNAEVYDLIGQCGPNGQVWGFEVDTCTPVDLTKHFAPMWCQDHGEAGFETCPFAFEPLLADELAWRVLGEPSTGFLAGQRGF